MKYIDMHCDTLSRAYFDGNNDIYKLDKTSLDINRLKKVNSMAQFFAIYLVPDDEKEGISDEEYILSLLNIFNNTVKNHSDILSVAYSFNDIIKNEKQKKISAILTIEDGRCIDGKLENIKKYYDLGIRLISLTWNNKNCFGSPNSDDINIMKCGLTYFGKEAVQYMNDLGMIIDVSHLSDGGFYDVANLSKKPFVASHSNSRSITNHSRNLTDDMIKIISNRGGVIGINFCPKFLDNRELNDENKESKIQYMIEHIEHIINVGGEDCVCIGTDFDGIHGNLEIDSVSKMPLLFEKMNAYGFKYDFIEKFAYKNAYRTIKDIIG